MGVLKLTGVARRGGIHRLGGGRSLTAMLMEWIKGLSDFGESSVIVISRGRAVTVPSPTWPQGIGLNWA